MVIGKPIIMEVNTAGTRKPARFAELLQVTKREQDQLQRIVIVVRR